MQRKHDAEQPFAPGARPGASAGVASTVASPATALATPGAQPAVPDTERPDKPVAKTMAKAAAKASAAGPADDASSASPPITVEGPPRAGGAPTGSHMAQDAGIPYNGGRCVRYHWEQTLGDVTIHAPVPDGTRGHEVQCDIGKGHLTLGLKKSAVPIVDANFPCDARNGTEHWEKVRTSESYWNLGQVGGQLCISVYLEKERESWWNAAVHGGGEIDTTKVDSTRDLSEYDGETQGAIRKIMFDQVRAFIDQTFSK